MENLSIDENTRYLLSIDTLDPYVWAYSFGIVQGKDLTILLNRKVRIIGSIDRKQFLGDMETLKRLFDPSVVEF